MKPFLQRKTSDDQKSICTATVNQEKVGTSSPDKDMPMNIPPPPATDVATSSGKSVSQFFSRNDVLNFSKVTEIFKFLCALSPAGQMFVSWAHQERANEKRPIFDTFLAVT